MTRSEFEAQYGPIAIEEKQDQFFKKLQHPQWVDGLWKKPNPNHSEGLSILKGTFYNIGFFPEEQDPFQLEHDWEALAYAIGFTKNLVQTLEDGQCFAGLGSEDDLYWFPLLVTIPKQDEDFRFTHFIISPPPEEVVAAYASGSLEKYYDNSINTKNIDMRNNIFWKDKKEDTMKAGLEASAYDAYSKVTELMKSCLTDIRRTHCYSDYLEFPVLFYGKDKYGNYLGVMTAVSWT